MAEWVTVDPEAEAAFIEDGKPVLAEAARLAGWNVEDVWELQPTGGKGPRANARVFKRNGQFMDIRLPEDMMN